METRVITDFDGPLMDVSGRYYHVYQLCLEKNRADQSDIRLLPKSEFWQLKRNRVTEEEIGIISGLGEFEAKSFAKMRKATVHDLCYFEHDEIIPGVFESLERAQNMGLDLALMTMRRRRELEQAFQRYQFERFFREDRCYCLADDFIKTTDVQDKPTLMDRAQRELPPVQSTWMIGDTEADIAAAKKYQVKMIAVLSGIRSRDLLEKYDPDYIVDDLAQAIDLIAEHV